MFSFGGNALIIEAAFSFLNPVHFMDLLISFADV